jgi:putative ABC transport system ATP-binding protein
MVDGTIVSNVVMRDAVMICEFLRSVELFNHLTPIDLTNIAEKIKRRRFAAEEVIIREGDVGEEFYLISEGSVRVLRRMDSGEERIHVATLHRGDFFGERALIADEPRNATVVANEEVEVLTLGKDEFRSALNSSPSFRDQLHRVYFQRQ